MIDAAVSFIFRLISWWKEMPPAVRSRRSGRTYLCIFILTYVVNAAALLASLPLPADLFSWILMILYPLAALLFSHNISSRRQRYGLTVVWRLCPISALSLALLLFLPADWQAVRQISGTFFGIVHLPFRPLIYFDAIGSLGIISAAVISSILSVSICRTAKTRKL